MSSSVKLALRSFSSIFSAWLTSKVSCARSTRVRMSPIPRIRPASRSGWKTSSASVFSPVPRNLTGIPVTAEMLRAAPPRASPSIFGEDEPGDGHRRDESLRDADGLLAGHGVDDEERLDRLDRRVDGRDLLP